MELISKRSCFVVFALAILCLISRYILCYTCGYYQESFSPISLQELLAFLGLVLIFVTFVIWIVSLVRKRQQHLATTLLVSLFVLGGLKYVIPWPHDLIIYGLRAGMMQNYGLNEMRRFARDFDKLPKIPNNDVNGHMKLYWNRLKNDDLPKTGLKQKYPFLANCEAVVEWDDNVVHVEWGGFENHWGFSVSVDGKRIDRPHLEPRNRIDRVSDDVFFTSDY